MKLRAFTESDIAELREIHKRCFDEEFPFPNFLENYLSSFVVIDSNDKIITGGGVRVITEAVMVTDKNYEIVKRREAMLQMMQASMFTSASRGFNQLHAFVQDEKWLKHLERIGFKKSKGQTLVIGV